MKTSKIYYRKDNNGNIWCYGYHNGTNWRVFNTDRVINRWFNWSGCPLNAGIFFPSDYILANNFKEKTKC